MKCKAEDFGCAYNPNRREVERLQFTPLSRDKESEFGVCPFFSNGECTSEKCIEYYLEMEAKRKADYEKDRINWNKAEKEAVKLKRFTLKMAVYLRDNFSDWEYSRIKNPDTKKRYVFIYSENFKKFMEGKNPDEFMEGLK